MHSRIILAILFCFFGNLVISQESFHRLYESDMADTIFYHMNTTSPSGNVNAIGTRRFEDVNLALIYTQLDVKGNIKETSQLDLGRDSITIFDGIQLGINTDTDTLLFSFEGELDGNFTSFFGRKGYNGLGSKLYTVNGLPTPSFSSTSHVSSFLNNTDLYMTSGTEPTLNKIGGGIDVKWSKKYSLNDDQGNQKLKFVSDMKTAQDSTIVLVGPVEADQLSFAAAQLDSNGVQLWANEYQMLVEGATLESINPSEIIGLSDGSFAVVGDYVLDAGASTVGFIAQMDTLGRLTSIHRYVLNQSYTSIRNMIEGVDGSIWCSGVYSSNMDSTKYFTSSIDRSGSINFTTSYNIEVPIADYNTTNLIPSANGATMVGHGMQGNFDVLNVMKHDVNGEAMCSDTIFSLFQQLTYGEDTIIIATEDGSLTFNELERSFETVKAFSPPVLSITPVGPYCPNELIDTFLVAQTGLSDDVASYMWASGELNDTLHIDMEGEYSVIVTVTEDVCFKLCDTIEVMLFDPVTVDIKEDFSLFCQDGTVTLLADPGGNAFPLSFLWSNNSEEQSITVDQEGTYSVTVTDNCGIVAMDDITVTFPEYDPKAFATPNVTNFCNDQTVTIIGFYNEGGPNPQYLWSTNETSKDIVVTEGGTYSLTVTDDCGLMATAVAEVEIPILPGEVTIGYEIVCDETNIDDSYVVFEATGTNPEAEFTLEVYNTDGQIVNNDNPSKQLVLALYNVVAVDFCGEMTSDSINVTGACGLFKYPLGFFPNGSEDIEKTFGPIFPSTLDLTRVTEYDFKIYNRWGQNVFSSTEVNTKWDGNHGGSQAPTEVYMWYATYLLDGEEMLDKGDVTLIR